MTSGTPIPHLEPSVEVTAIPEEGRRRQERTAALFAQIDFEALQATVDQTKLLLRSPYFAILDTEFFRSAFRSMVRYPGSVPGSLRETKAGHIRLFMAEETAYELLGKLEVWASALGIDEGVLLGFLEEWAPSIWIVSLPESTSDPRVEAIAQRDASDLPAARLVALLAPCILLSRDRDFAAFEVAEPSNPLRAIRASVILDDLTVEVRSLVMVPVIPITAIAGGIGWAGRKIGVNPWILGGVISTVVVLWARRTDAEQRTALKQFASEMGTKYLEQLAAVHAAQRTATYALEQRIVHPHPTDDPERLVLRELAYADEPMSAQTIWEELDPISRPSVTAVRTLLRDHPAVVRWGRDGQWCLGRPLDEWIDLLGR